ncbi:hypothetical protein EYZ11_012795 [Aspergillus tanneri]|uniref:Uncharacterized protein n=1 Tax=Aspergillus tanneri TaxID=1220188 RepID=A0A4S3IZB3_9EURO|nr:hypothetical protein EYZ11_012795 [Aspergillus tanneri]
MVTVLEHTIDFHWFETGYGGFKGLMLANNQWSGLIWDYYLEDHTADSIIHALRHLLGVLKRMDIKAQVIKCDNKTVGQKPRTATFLMSDL